VRKATVSFFLSLRVWSQADLYDLYIYIYIYTRIHTHICIYTYIYTHKVVQLLLLMQCLTADRQCQTTSVPDCTCHVAALIWYFYWTSAIDTWRWQCKWKMCTWMTWSNYAIINKEHCLFKIMNVISWYCERHVCCFHHARIPFSHFVHRCNSCCWRDICGWQICINCYSTTTTCPVLRDIVYVPWTLGCSREDTSFLFQFLAPIR
jgi:hypothetical protein